MKKIELVKGIKSSALGFGCAPILGSVGAKAALSALECALDYNINHFDLARSYGYGEAEKFVGKVIKGKRDQVVLASKFGIIANWKAIILRPAKPVVRFFFSNLNKNSFKKQHPSTGEEVKVADRFHNHIELSGKMMRNSLEKSLKALGTDYLDYYLLHEPIASIGNIDELAAVAEMLKAEGKIRAWGIAFMRSQAYLHQAYLGKFDVWQFDNSPGANGYDDTVENRGQKSNIIFSPLSNGAKNETPAKKLGKLFNDFPQSVILCSMFNERHIKENASLLTDNGEILK